MLRHRKAVGSYFFSDWETFIKGLSCDQLAGEDLVRGNWLQLLWKGYDSWLQAQAWSVDQRLFAWLMVQLEEQLPSSLSASLFPFSPSSPDSSQLVPFPSHVSY